MAPRQKTSTTRLPLPLLQEIEAQEHNDNHYSISKIGRKRKNGSQGLSRKEQRKLDRSEKKRKLFGPVLSEPELQQSENSRDSQKTLNSADDTMAKLTALKKSKEAQKSTGNAAEDTWAKLKALKENKAKSEAGVKTTTQNTKKRIQETKKSDPSRRRPESYQEAILTREEQDMAYYAKKLGIKGKKLPKGDDGLDEIFSEPSESEESVSDLEMSDSDLESDDGLEIGEEMDNEGTSEESDDDEDEAPAVKENPYLPGGNAGKYIPPAQRAKALARDSKETEELLRLRRCAKGLLNRLSEANQLSILSELNQLYLSNPRQSVTSTITSLVLESVSVQNNLLDTFVILHACLMTALYRNRGIDFGAHFVQTLMENFLSSAQSSDNKRQAGNLIVLLSELYTFQMVSCSLLYDVIKFLAHDITEDKTEFLLRLLRNSGTQLRQDDPSALRDIILLMQKEVSQKKKGQVSSRMQFLLDTVIALKNNKSKMNTEAAKEMVTRMKKSLGKLPLANPEPIRVTLDDIRNIEMKGKWWLVGAAWRNNQNSSENDTEELSDNLDLLSAQNATEDAATNWGVLARRMRMNTDIRRAIFVALMSSEDYVDACDKLMKLGLKKVQEREIPRIILHCCSSEQAFNPFYAFVAKQLCSQHSIKKSFQFCLWDYLRELSGEDNDNDDDLDLTNQEENEDTKLRKLMNFARFYACLMAEGVFGFTLLKTVDFASGTSEMSIFLDLLFVTLFTRLGKKAKAHARGAESREDWDDKVLINMVIQAREEKTLLRSIGYFLNHTVAKTTTAESKTQKEYARWGSEVFCDVVEGLAREY